MTRSISRPTRKIKLHLFVVAALGVLSGTTALAAESAAVGAAQVVARNVAARGGEPAWRKIESIEFIGKMDAARPRPALRGTIDDPKPDASSRHKPRSAASGSGATANASKAEAVQLPYRLELKRPHKSRLEIDFQGQTAVQVYDGKEGWKLQPYLGRSKPVPFTPDELKLAGNEPELDGWLIGAATNGTRVSMDRTETVEGRSTYRLKLQLKNGDIRHVWVDAGTFLETRVDGKRKFNGKVRTTYTYFRDYRTVDGVSIPHLLETTIEGQRSTDKIVIDKVVINPELPNSRFAMPLPAAGKSAEPLAPATPKAKQP